MHNFAHGSKSRVTKQQNRVYIDSSTVMLDQRLPCTRT